MARHESDREDLFAEATALVRRAEFRGTQSCKLLTAGFRRTGELSLYCGADPAWHFDAAGRLKRAYRHGKLLRTQGTTLAELTRQRTSDETVLARRDLTPANLQEVFEQLETQLRSLLRELAAGSLVLVRQSSIEDDCFRDDFAEALENALQAAVRRELAQRFPGKR